MYGIFYFVHGFGCTCEVCEDHIHANENTEKNSEKKPAKALDTNTPSDKHYNHTQIELT